MSPSLEGSVVVMVVAYLSGNNCQSFFFSEQATGVHADKYYGVLLCESNRVFVAVTRLFRLQGGKEYQALSRAGHCGPQ